MSDRNKHGSAPSGDYLFKNRNKKLSFIQFLFLITLIRRLKQKIHFVFIKKNIFKSN